MLPLLVIGGLIAALVLSHSGGGTAPAPPSPLPPGLPTITLNPPVTLPPNTPAELAVWDQSGQLTTADVSVALAAHGWANAQFESPNPIPIPPNRAGLTGNGWHVTSATHPLVLVLNSFPIPLGGSLYVLAIVANETLFGIPA